MKTNNWRSSRGSRQLSRWSSSWRSRESDSSSSSSHSRRRKRKSKRRRLKPRRDPVPSDSSPTESVCVLEYVDGTSGRRRTLELANPPGEAGSITRLPGIFWKNFLRGLKHGEIEQVCLITDADSALLKVNAVRDDDAPSRPKSAALKSAREKRFAAQSWEALRKLGNPVYESAREYEDVFPDNITAELPADRGICHEIDLKPGSKYCVTWQWPLPRDQVQPIDDFFESHRKAGHVRESTSPHSSPTFCVKKATGRWRIVHAFNKMNDATIPAQTPIPRKDMVLDAMSAVSTPSSMLWEWLVIPQGLKNAPATFNRMVSHVLRQLRDFAPSYFDDIFVHSRAKGGLSALEVHLKHLRQVFQVVRATKLYANLKKCIFCAPEIPVLGCFVSKNGVRADPEKVSSVCAWHMPQNPTELRQWLGLANYLHKYTKNYAGLIQPLSSLLKKDVSWSWTSAHQAAFDSVKKSLAEAPILALPDDSKSFHVVCDASDFAVGCALMQFDDEGRERVVSYQYRQMKPAERNYPVHDKEPLAMRYALIKFRVYLLGEDTFAPGKNNILADALSRRPDYDPRDALGRQASLDEDDVDECDTCEVSGVNLTIVSPVIPLRDEIRAAYDHDSMCSSILEHLRSPSADIHRYRIEDVLLTYSIDSFDTPRVVVPNDPDIRSRIVHEFDDAPLGAHLGREKPFAAVSRDLFWPHLHKWVCKWVRTCEFCQRVKPASSSQAPLRPLPLSTEAWRSVSMNFIFGLPPDAKGRSGVLVFVDRFIKMVHLIPVSDSITAADTAVHFVDAVFRHHGLPEPIVSDRDPRFTSAFWSKLFELLGSKLLMSTASHPETDDQTERVNRVLEDVLRSYATSFSSWSSFLPLAEFALNNAVHASTGLTPFFINNARHPRVPALLAVGHLTAPCVSTLVDKQKENADKTGRKNTATYMTGERVLLSTEGITNSAVTNLGANKLTPRFIGPFTKYRPSEIPDADSSSSDAATFQRDGPPPLIDSSGAQRWIVERIVDHDLRQCHGIRDGHTEADKEQHYRVHWLGLSPGEDTWEPRSRLLEDVPDIVNEYEKTLTFRSVSEPGVDTRGEEGDQPPRVHGGTRRDD
ncbi:Calponin homology domain-containing proteinromo [Phytophthora infestans]|uniref:Calponin homology domain-containing proteinromo n=1 Tax=Phytophthora infestans TaxID=4787 RepID=A0A833S4L1_PHYIN|nr:Calponin homology domain-containing proteinromo [Phytophthora infestans]